MKSLNLAESADKKFLLKYFGFDTIHQAKKEMQFDNAKNGYKAMKNMYIDIEKVKEENKKNPELKKVASTKISNFLYDKIIHSPENKMAYFRKNGEYKYKPVEQYNINLTNQVYFRGEGDADEIYNLYVFPMLLKLKNKYKNAVIKIALSGKWSNTEFYNDKLDINSFVLKYKNFIKVLEFLKETKYGEGDFRILNIEFNVIKPLTGGCYSTKGHGKDMKVNNLKVHNPYSTNNNCLFKCIEKHLDFKPTKLKCNEIRKEFHIPDNECISIQDAYKIAKKYTDKSVSVITNDLDILYGDDNADIKIFCMNNHYMTLEATVKNCKDCGKMYIQQHKCNKKRCSYYNQKVLKRLIEPVEINDKGLLDDTILHYDIETHRKNELNEHTPYIVGYAYYTPDYELIYNTFQGDNCMKEFYEFLGNVELNHIKYINAFNGSNFDHYYLFREKVFHDSKKVGKFILNNGGILSATIKGKKLIDLGRHLTGSLADNLEGNNCSVAKGCIDHNISTRWEETNDERKNKVLEYLKCDVIGLQELYEKVNSPIYDKYSVNLCEFMTTSSCAFKIWRDVFLKDEVHLPNAYVETCFRQSVYGGRCYKNKNRFLSKQYRKYKKGLISYDEIVDYIFDADVVSLYPTAMLKEFPIGKEKITTNYKKGKMGIYYIKYKANKKLLTPILPRKEDKKLIWDLNDGEGWYNSVDIENALAKGYEIDVEKGYFWEETAPVFKEYIEEFYKMKKNATKGTPAYTTAKLYLNALYGKMIQKPIFQKDEIIKTSEDFWRILNKNIITSMVEVNDVWLVQYVAKEEFKNPSGADKPTQFGSFILSYSRQIMIEHYDKCGNTMDRLPYYFDTDSLNIHSSCLDKIKIDKSLGGIDDDVGGKVIKAIYISPKMYAFQVAKKEGGIKYHFRGKGVSNDKLCWGDFELMDRGASKRYFRDFQIKKIGMKKTTNLKGYNYFSHKHIESKDTGKYINKTIWAGRKFIDDNNSVPYGYEQ
jgi:hypothetical protein